MDRIIHVTSRCNQKCLFCFRMDDSQEPGKEALIEEIRRAAADGADNVVFSGGEPTLSPLLPGLIRHARESGAFREVGLQTNGVLLSDTNLVSKLKNAGLDFAFLPLHSHIPRVSEFMTGAGNTWHKTCQAIHNLHHAGLAVFMNIVINSVNYRGLPEYVAFIAREFPFVEKLDISVVNPSGRARNNAWIVPRHEEIGPYITEAHRLCELHGIHSVNPLCGLPLCMLPSQVDKSLEHVFTEQGRDRDKDARDMAYAEAAAHKVKSPSCAQCRYDARCLGVWKGYAEIHGLDGLLPFGETEKQAPCPDPEKPTAAGTFDAEQKRHWVRVNRVCNNRCMFCLDAELQDGAMLPREQVEKDIERGLELGARRLVLSGGEPTIHPDIAHFVEHGRKCGYEKVQIITNGRMFAYSRFANTMIRAGLGEATFSLHSHEPQVLDTLTGTRGGFAQAVAGLVNLIRHPQKIDISIDIVLNRLNIGKLWETIRFFHQLGVHEFDLLHLVPFGRAWPGNRDLLFCEEDEIAEAVAKAYSMAESRDIVLWTNRLPAPWLETREHLIQNPNKIFDEVRGRRDLFDGYLKHDRDLSCEGERCKHCFMRRFCNTLKDYYSASISKGFQGLEIDLDSGVTPDQVQKGIEACAQKFAALHCSSPEQLNDFISEPSGADLNICLDMAPDFPPESLHDLLASHPQVYKIIVRREIDMDLFARFHDLEMEIRINRHNVSWLLEHLDLLERRADRIILSMDQHAHLKEVNSEALNLAQLKEHLHYPGMKQMRIPHCLIAGQTMVPPLVLNPSIMDDDFKIDIFSFTAEFINKHYLEKSTRCRSCRLDSECGGVHINYLRAFGFQTLKPIE